MGLFCFLTRTVTGHGVQTKITKCDQIKLYKNIGSFSWNDISRILSGSWYCHYINCLKNGNVEFETLNIISFQIILLMVCIWRHGGHVGGTTQRNMLSIPLSDPAGVGGWHCLPYPDRLIANQGAVLMSRASPANRADLSHENLYFSTT